MRHTFKIQAEKCNMKISTSKTKSMTISKDPLRRKVVVDLASIEQIMFFNYLGCKITRSGSLKEEIRQQSNTAAVTSEHLKQTI
jgi:hypothetical protein